ncbi:2-oxoglutarate dehydrogenase, E2 component, dihydrolipoamide succinyltransferase [Demequina aurantiaca]|uniref:2-oxoglutarate dehydrogenase, E2 component, dihydrolipoamide succinyltransferase n=1 Tax=Demequina aurantiaca TaxID=676200 RepID=UPI00078574FB|nr:2-oxoglutarate dehydrogenase, E2 component, dihydrolipoamide succinyltransferase [Demequina aurantiaca]
MSNDVTLPALGESVTEGTVTRWLKNVGDTVEVDEPLLEVSTDKVDTEIPSPFAGTLTEILIQEDEDAEVGAVLARIGEAGESAGGDDATAEESTSAESAPAESAPSDDAGASAAEPAPAEEAPAEPEEKSEPEQEEKSAPAESAAPAAGGQDVTLPALGESVTEGTVTRWLKSVGDSVEQDEPLLEVSTDKVDTEIPSPFAGTLTEILVQEDEDAEVGAVLARIGDGNAAPAAPAGEESTPSEADAEADVETDETEPEAPAAGTAAAPAEQKAAPEPQSAPEPEAAQKPADSAPAASAPAPAATDAGSSNGSGYVTPIVRKLAAERGVDLAGLTGTGVGGRIRKEDVLEAATKADAPAVTPASTDSSAAAATPATASESAASGELVESDLRGTTVKMSRIRKITSEKMMESLHGMAQLTSVVEVDCSKIWALRAKAKDGFQEREGVKLTFLPFFTKAVAEALAEHAFLNASVDGTNIVYHDSVNLSLAVDTEKGLMLPTMRGAEHLTVGEHAKAIADLAEKARTGGLSSDEISGGTFAVTNTGSGGTMFDTPIVPAPQVGILATCAIVKKPVVVRGPNGEDVISIRPMCYLPLSYDHRIVDGADAAKFLQSVKKRLEEGAFESEVGL